MARKNATLNAKAFKKDLKKLEKFVYGRFAKSVLNTFKKETPRGDGPLAGNAKRNTKLKVSKSRQQIAIQTKYGYADVLDEGLYPNPPKKGTGKTIGGYSTQAQKGMSDPTAKKAEKEFDNFVRRL